MATWLKCNLVVALVQWRCLLEESCSLIIVHTTASIFSSIKMLFWLTLSMASSYSRASECYLLEHVWSSSPTSGVSNEWFFDQECEILYKMHANFGYENL